MPTTMALWLADDGSATPLVQERLTAEAVIESAVESAPELLGVDVVIIGRQVATPSGPLDLLAIDSGGHLVVIENKRDRTPRDVLAQTLDYAAYVATLTFDDVSSLYESYRLRAGATQTDLAEAYEEHFGEPLDALADTPRMMIVASRLDDATERMIGFLADKFGVPVNAALFQPFEGGLIGRTWLRPEDSVRTAGRSAASSESRDQAKAFWDAWLPIGRPALTGIRLPANGPRSVLIKRRVTPGIPAALVVWVSASEAYAEVQFDDDEPSMNQALLTALREHRSEIDEAFGEALEWRGAETGGLMTKRTKVVTPKVQIGDRVSPTSSGLHGLTDAASRILAAVRPFLQEASERAAIAIDALEGSVDELAAATGDSQPNGLDLVASGSIDLARERP